LGIVGRRNVLSIGRPGKAWNAAPPTEFGYGAGGGEVRTPIQDTNRSETLARFTPPYALGSG